MIIRIKVIVNINILQLKIHLLIKKIMKKMSLKKE